MKANKNEEADGDFELTGVVVEKPFGTGSKSQHAGIFLQTADGDFQLRRLGGNPFADAELKKLVGENVCAVGRLVQTLFIASEIKKL